MSFDYLSAQELKPGKIVKVQLHQLRGAPILHVEHAGDSNDGYMVDMQREARANAEMLGGSEYDRASEAALLAKLKARYARHVVRDIEGVFHDDGSPATKADIPEFIAKMPRHVFMTLVGFCRNPMNFIGASAP